jgi:hypothetical protein
MQEIIQNGERFLIPDPIPALAGSKRAIKNWLDEFLTSQGKQGTPYQEAYLRMEALLGNTNSISFNPISSNNQNSAPSRATERRLNQKDSFLVTQIGFGISKQATGAAAGSMVIDTYVNPQIFTGSGEAAALQHLYNGTLSMTADSQVTLVNYDMLKFEQVDTAQQLLAQTVTTGILAGATSAYARSAKDPDKMFKDIDPFFFISGNTSTEFMLSLGESANMTGTSSNNYAVLMLRGIRIPNFVTA